MGTAHPWTVGSAWYSAWWGGWSLPHPLRPCPALPWPIGQFLFWHARILEKNRREMSKYTTTLGTLTNFSGGKELFKHACSKISKNRLEMTPKRVCLLKLCSAKSLWVGPMWFPSSLSPEGQWHSWLVHLTSPLGKRWILVGKSHHCLGDEKSLGHLGF